MSEAAPVSLKTEPAGFSSYVGPLKERDLDGKSIFEIEILPQHLNGADRLHGGMSMAIASMALGTVAAKLAEGDRVVPLSLNCDFVSAAVEGEEVTAQVEVTRRTRTVIFLSGQLQVEDRILMTATGVYRVAADAS